MDLELLFKLLCGHALADFALQSEFIATNKNRNAVPKGYDPKVHGPTQTIWPHVLAAHALIHGFMVYAATGSLTLGVLETGAHGLVDFGKCEKWYGVHSDQFLHLCCKLLWMGLLRCGIS